MTWLPQTNQQGFLALQGHCSPRDGERLRSALKTLRNIPQLFHLPQNQQQRFGFSPRCLTALAHPNQRCVERHLTWLAQHPQHHYVPLSDPNYPSLLKRLNDPPIGLFVQGQPSLLNQFQIALVGARKATPSGIEFSQRLAKQLGQVGFVITSGLAHGIDGAAHRGALANHTPTLAVTGTGLDQTYPRQHHSLARKIIEQGGALISEFLLGSKPQREHFPLRNRIIAGLSLGTCVIEAAISSGSLITANLALKYNREVFAVPGSPLNCYTEGCHRLIQQGAKLITNAEQIICELPFLMQTMIASKPEDQDNGKKRVNFGRKKDIVLETIGYEATSIDKIVARSGLSPAEVSALLVELELERKVASSPGGFVGLTSNHPPIDRI